MKKLRAASPQEIAEVKGVPEAVAEEIWQVLRAVEADAAQVVEAAEE